MGKRHILLAFAAAALVCLCGCTVITKDGNEKVRDIDFTVLAEDNIPDELKQVIEEKKEKEEKGWEEEGRESGRGRGRG